MSADHVTLTDDERDAIVTVNHCQPDGAIMRDLVPVIEAIIAAREKALREEIARDLKRDGGYLTPYIARGGTR